jgi:outer membrane protein assembly factor BamB
VVDGRVLVAGCDGRLHLVDATTGEGLESIDIGGPADGIPAALGDRVYFCTANGVFHAMTLKPLAGVWQYVHRGQGEEIHGAAVTDIAVVLGTHDKRLVGLDPATGEELWSFRTRVRVQCSPVLVGKLAIFGSLRGRLSAVDITTGKPAWEEDLGGRFTASPAVSDSRVAIGNEDGTLYCIGGKRE